MTTINVVYDETVGKRETNRWHLNTYNDKYYPINGPHEECYFDYHAPIVTVLENNNYDINVMSLRDALTANVKFTYVLTFRFLYGNICFSEENYNIFNQLPVGIVNAVNAGRCLLVLHDGHECAYYDTRFQTYLCRNLDNTGIDYKNVLIITGNPNNDNVIFDVKIVFWQFFETAMRLSVPKQINNACNFDRHNLKKFLCLNRVAREPRYYFMHEMYKRNLLEHFNASLDKVSSIEDIKSYNDNIFLNSLQNSLSFTNMLLSLPWTVDTDKFEINYWNSVDTRFARNNLIFVVTETIFKDDADNIFLTEKTFKPIALKMPFIILAQPSTLKRLQSLGYKTFNHIWDESYDEEPDVLKRMNMICELIENLSKISTEELVNVITQSKDILEHNFNLLLSRRPELAVTTTIDNFFKDEK
jgi:hypothetical protein